MSSTDANSAIDRNLGLAAREWGVHAGLLVLRGWFGLVLALSHGLNKLHAPASFLGKVAELGFPLPTFFGWAAILSEFVGGILLAIGLATRPAAFFVATTLVVAAVKVHAADPFAKKELALAYAVAALALLLIGPGRLSIDGLLAQRRRRASSR